MKELGKLRAGHYLKSKRGNYYLVLKVVGDAYVQEAFDGRWSTQSRNEEKGVVAYIWDGRFTNKRSLKELDMLCDEILAPIDPDIFEIFKKINE